MLLKKFLLFAGAVLASIAPSLAGVADVVTTKVTPISNPVTYQIAASGATGTVPLNTLVAYEVEIGRTGTNTVNSAVFTATAVTSAASGAASTPLNANPKFVRVESNASANGGSEVSCSGAGTPTVTCALGTLRAGETRTFGIYFEAPVNAELKLTGTEVVKLMNVWTDYSEAQGTSNDRSTANVVDEVDLGTSNPTRIKSALSKQGGSFYTGDNGVPKSDLVPFSKRSAVLLTVPATTDALLTAAEIQLVRDPLVACGSFIRCHTANITIDGLDFPAPLAGPASKYLTITIRIDSEDVGQFFRESNIAVQYIGDTNPLPNCTFVTVTEGNTTTQRPVLSAGAPRCVGAKFRYGNAARLGDLRGDVEVTVYALSNGGYKVLS